MKIVQLKVEPLKMYTSTQSPLYIPQKTTVQINCSAYGNTREMTGSIAKSGETFPSEVERKGNLFTIKAYVRDVQEDGIYVCSINNGRRQVVQTIQVKIFNRKLE